MAFIEGRTIINTGDVLSNEMLADFIGFNLGDTEKNVVEKTGNNIYSRLPARYTIPATLALMTILLYSCSSGQQDVVNQGATTVANVESTLEAAQAGLCEGVNAGDLIPCQENPQEIFQPPSIDDAVDNIMAAQGVSPGEIEAFRDWWNKYGALARTITQIIDDATSQPTQYYDFSEESPAVPRSEGEQLDILYDLVDSTKNDPGRELVLNIGPAGTISPLQTAMNRENTTVIAIDNFQPPPWRIDPNMPTFEGEIPETTNETSFANFFSLDAFAIDPTKIGEHSFDEVHLFAPSPNDARYLATIACALGKKVILIPDPSIPQSYVLDEIIQGMTSKGCRAELVPLDLDQIKNLTGATHSWTHIKEFAKDKPIDVIIGVAE